MTPFERSALEQALNALVNMRDAFGVFSIERLDVEEAISSITNVIERISMKAD